MPFNEKQVRQLLAPIHPKRVLKDGKSNNHVAANDIIAHLNRIFGFGGFDIDVLSTELIFEDRHQKDGRDKWNVCYKALVRLTVKDETGAEVCHYEDGSMGSSQGMPSRADAHDLGLKSAISLAIKRAAKDLGDGFGLSLYSRGQLSAIVKGTLVGLPDAETKEDVQADVDQVVSMGHDETDHEPDPADIARHALRVLCAERGWDMQAVAQAYEGDLRSATADEVQAFTTLLHTGAVTV